MHLGIAAQVARRDRSHFRETPCANAIAAMTLRSRRALRPISASPFQKAHPSSPGIAVRRTASLPLAYDRAIQYSRGGSDRAEKPRRTGRIQLVVATSFAEVLRRPVESALGRPVKPGDDDCL